MFLVHFSVRKQTFQHDDFPYPLGFYHEIQLSKGLLGTILTYSPDIPCLNAFHAHSSPSILVLKHTCGSSNFAVFKLSVVF